MFCYNCGKEVDDNAVICVNCGVALKKSEPSETKVEEEKPKRGKGIASMILGIVSIIFVLLCLASLSSVISSMEYALEFDESYAEYSFAYKLGVCIGLSIYTLPTSITGLCLACSERKRTSKNGFNTSGLWLNLITLIITGIMYITVFIN